VSTVVELVKRNFELANELETTKKQLNDSMNFHCPNFTTTDSGYVACNLDKHKILMELETTKKLLINAIGIIEHYGNRMDSGGTARGFLKELDEEFLAKLSKEGK